jgi:[protein-PII] uridylyltransferase
MRGEYERRMVEIRRGFELNGDGLRAAAARTTLVDEMVLRLWGFEVAEDPKLAQGVVLTAVGGYGRGLLFPYSDVDLMVCVDKAEAKRAKEPIRRMSQSLWDCGMQVSLSTRQPGECERFEVGNAEFGLSLLDMRAIGGDPALFARLRDKYIAKLRAKDAKGIATELARLTRERHAKYGDTLFHLEPNIKECPGGLRDANVCEWLDGLGMGGVGSNPHLKSEMWGTQTHGTQSRAEFGEAVAFLAATRCFLHYRHERDDNTLDWQAQDAAAAAGIGLGREAGGVSGAARTVDGGYWMRVYFRHARSVDRQLLRTAEAAGLQIEGDGKPRRVRLSTKTSATPGLVFEDSRIGLAAAAGEGDVSHEPEVVLDAFAVMARTGARLTAEAEERIADAIPLLSANLEEGPGLWRKLAAILTGPKAGAALRSMHALGVLELILPEFHGIDALVIRDAYHRYTVDEHTFVVIDTLHGLEEPEAADAPDWRKKFGSMVRELQNPALLYLAALLHDTGKGRAGGHHAVESVALARGVLARLEMDAYDAGLVMRLIEMHLEMSAALRRDIFDAETVRGFAAKVQTQESLRMLTLFTYADIAAVHPDALTPWKAENLWRLSMATANHLDRNVDEERVQAVGSGLRGGGEKVQRLLAMTRGREALVEGFLDGFPERYVFTCEAEEMLRHFEMTQRFAEEEFQITFDYGEVSEITLVTHDRPRLFAGMAAALAAWGMNVVTADGFANRAGVVVDTFRFTDTFRTLELNESERERFVVSVRDLVAGRVSVEKMLSGRRRGRRRAPKVLTETRIEFDNKASSHSTLLQVIAQDVPGLLRAISATLSERGYNVEVALVDTEGEAAIDVFYLTAAGEKLTRAQEGELRTALTAAIAENAV